MYEGGEKYPRNDGRLVEGGGVDMNQERVVRVRPCREREAGIAQEEKDTWLVPRVPATMPDALSRISLY